MSNGNPNGPIFAREPANRKKWKEEVEFGLRWIVEIVISAFKRVLGESVRALKPYTTFIAVVTKIAAYNYYLDVGDATVKVLRQLGCREIRV